MLDIKTGFSHKNPTAQVSQGVVARDPNDPQGCASALSVVLGQVYFRGQGFDANSKIHLKYNQADAHPSGLRATTLRLVVSMRLLGLF